MTRQEEYIRWITPRLSIHLWHCGDEWCDCWQPQVDIIRPNLEVGFPRIKRERVWSGMFRSEPSYEESELQRRQLIEVREELGLNGDQQEWSLAAIDPFKLERFRARVALR